MPNKVFCYYNTEDNKDILNIKKIEMWNSDLKMNSFLKIVNSTIKIL